MREREKKRERGQEGFEEMSARQMGSTARGREQKNSPARCARSANSGKHVKIAAEGGERLALRSSLATRLRDSLAFGATCHYLLNKY